MQPFDLVVIGDPIVDVFLEGHYRNSRFVVEKETVFPGGALNTYHNTCALCSGCPIEITWATSVPDESTQKLTRLVDKQSKEIIEYWDIVESSRSYAYHQQGTVLYPTSATPHGILISGYNMGVVNSAPKNQEKIGWDFAIVDNRYRTLDLKYIYGAKTKLWHATGKEYCKEWAKNFDYVLWTNGPKTVQILSPDNKTKISLPVPPTRVIDPIGAGDTFVAAVGSYLAMFGESEIDETMLINASRFAIDCCQEVITKKYTMCTTKRVVNVYR